MHNSWTRGQDEIGFPLWDQNINKAEDRIEVVLTPQKDLNKLAEVIEFISEKILSLYEAELATLIS